MKNPLADNMIPQAAAPRETINTGRELARIEIEAMTMAICSRAAARSK
jgi:hypothetical protein